MTGSSATHNIDLDESVEAFTPEELFTAATGVHGAPRSWPELHGRPDVVVKKGLATLINTSLTPHQALVEDLLFIRDAFIAAGIDFVLVRGNDERPVLVVDAPLRRRVEKALPIACANAPIPTDRSPVPNAVEPIATLSCPAAWLSAPAASELRPVARACAPMAEARSRVATAL